MSPTTIFSVLAGIGALAAGLGVSYSQFKNGSDKIKDGLINDLKSKVDLKEKEVVELRDEKQTLIQSHQTQLNELNSKVGKLEGVNEANQKKLEEYKDILQNRDPELVLVLKEVRDLLASFQKTA